MFARLIEPFATACRVLMRNQGARSEKVEIPLTLPLTVPFAAVLAGVVWKLFFMFPDGPVTIAGPGVTIIKWFAEFFSTPTPML